VNESKRSRFEGKGWKIGSTREFLDLNEQEEGYVELQFKLADALKHRRKSRNLPQGDLAMAVSSSQSRVAKMELGDSSVALDPLVRSLLAMGQSNSDPVEITVTSNVRQKAA
jgi:predicted XRE-type DNA-binding protein